jgi:hypothetical protein
VIEEVREVRQRISVRFDHDPTRLVAYYMELQERHRDRLIDPPRAAECRDGSAAQPVTAADPGTALGSEAKLTGPGPLS